MSRMTEMVDLRGENASLRQRNEQLVRRAADAEQAFEAFARGEVDAVTLHDASTPVLLQAAQEKLRSSEYLLRAIFDGALDAMLLTDDQGRYVDANSAACALYKLPLDQLVGRSLGELRGPELVDAAAYRALRVQGNRRGHFTLERADGTRRLEYSSAFNVAPGIDLFVLRDITERVAAEEALRRNNALFRAVIEKSAEVMSLTLADGTTSYLTPSAWRLLGWTPEEMGTRTLRDQVVPEDRVRIASELSRLVATGARDMHMDFRVQHRDGSLRWIESTGTNLLDDPDVRAIVGNYRDITARKHAEEALRESRDRLQEAQAIAHVGSWSSGIEPGEEVAWSSECYRIFGVPDGTAMTVE
jgi:PAS domain S-box-containing protein